MLSAPFIVEHQLSVVTVTAPFQIEDVLSYLGRVRAGFHRGVRLDTPTILDFRGLRLAHMSAVDVHRFVVGRRAIAGEARQGPIMLYCGEARSFGLLRMFGMLAELHGFGDKGEIPVSMDPQDVLIWIYRHARLGPMDRMRVTNILTKLPGAAVF